ncbi:MAG: phosphodiester glycosidase family protein, partial [Actinobacteria bacterium]|nr:phosphodiester glycosidase family protein [Actinomycetota bacterium]
MGRATGAWLSLALVLVGATAAMSQSETPAGYAVVSRTELATGVEYLKLTSGGPDEVAHVAHVAPGAPVDLTLVNAHDKIPAGPSDLETTSSMCRRENCVVGVNGDFNVNGVPAGGVVAGGRMQRSPDPGLPQLTVMHDGHLVAGLLPWTGSFTFADGTPLAVATVNADPPAGGLALFTPDYGGATGASGRTELVVRAVHGSIGALNQPASVELQSVRTGAGPIPPDGAVLSADGPAAQQLLAAWGRKPNGASSRARLTVSSPVDAAESVGAYPVVLRGGKRALPWRDPNLINPRQPHTLVGWNDAGDVYLVAIDGRQPSAEGLTMAEAADFLVGLGVTDAVNLDGGGGTTFVTAGTVRNRPSDNDPARPTQYTERGAANAFVIVARPAPPPPTAISPMAIGTDTPSPSSPKQAPVPAGGGDDALFDPTLSASPIGPDGDAVIDGSPVAPAGPTEGNSNGLPASGDPVAAKSSSPGAGRGQLKTPSPAGSEEAAADAPATPDRGNTSETRKVTEVLRAPLSAASSITSDVIDAALGEHSAGPAGHATRTAAGVGAALGVAALVSRRRRAGRRPRPAEPATTRPPTRPDPIPVVEQVRSAPPEPTPLTAARLHATPTELAAVA